MTDWNSYYQSRFTYDPRRDKVWREICRWLRHEIAPTDTVLDLGAGYCHFINNVQAKRRIAVDIAPAVRELAANGVEAHVASCDQLGFMADGTADVAFASNLLEHLSMPDTVTALREIKRVLKSSGKLILLQPNFRHCYREYFDDYTHVTIHTDRSLADLLQAQGFRIRRCLPKFIPFSMNSGLPVIPALVWLYLRSPIKPRAGQMLLVAQRS